MSYGLKVAKEGKSTSDSDERNMVFDSTLNTFKFTKVGTMLSVTSAAGTDLTITHGLGYIPSFLIFAKNQDQAWGAHDGYVTYPCWDNPTGPTLIPTINAQTLKVHIYATSGAFHLFYLIGADDQDNPDS